MNWSFIVDLLLPLITWFQARTVDGDPGSPWRDVDHFDSLSTTLFEECSTVDDLFARAVRLYGTNPCVGTRQLLREEDEVQSNGRVFKKVVHV